VGKNGEVKVLVKVGFVYSAQPSDLSSVSTCFRGGSSPSQASSRNSARGGLRLKRRMKLLNMLLPLLRLHC
jgi:hypothetical protein